MQSLKKIHAWAQMKVPLYSLYAFHGNFVSFCQEFATHCNQVRFVTFYMYIELSLQSIKTYSNLL